MKLGYVLYTHASYVPSNMVICKSKILTVQNIEKYFKQLHKKFLFFKFLQIQQNDTKRFDIRWTSMAHYDWDERFSELFKSSIISDIIRKFQSVWFPILNYYFKKKYWTSKISRLNVIKNIIHCHVTCKISFKRYFITLNVHVNSLTFHYLIKFFSFINIKYII